MRVDAYAVYRDKSTPDVRVSGVRQGDDAFVAVQSGADAEVLVLKTQATRLANVVVAQIPDNRAGSLGQVEVGVSRVQDDGEPTRDVLRDIASDYDDDHRRRVTQRFEAEPVSFSGTIQVAPNFQRLWGFDDVGLAVRWVDVTSGRYVKAPVREGGELMIPASRDDLVTPVNAAIRQVVQAIRDVRESGR